jgi:hypothetical protein
MGWVRLGATSLGVTTTMTEEVPMIELSYEAREARVRRAARRAGEATHKVRENSQDYWQYGPYMVVDDRNCVVAYGLDLDGLEESYNELG